MSQSKTRTNKNCQRPTVLILHTWCDNNFNTIKKNNED